MARHECSQNWRTASAGRPRRCAVTISPTAGASGQLLAGRRRAQHAGPLDVRAVAAISPKGPAGKWTDAAAPGEHGDLLDVIRETLRPCRLHTTWPRKARTFLRLPHPEPEPGH